MKKAVIGKPAHLDGKIKNSNRTDSSKHCDKSATQDNVSSTKSVQSVSVKNKPHKSNKKWDKQHKKEDTVSEHSETTKDMRCYGTVKLTQQIRPQKPAEMKDSKKLKTESQTQTQQTLKQVKSLVVKNDGQTSLNDSRTSEVKNGESSGEKHRKRKKTSKKNQDGASNWMKLCATLNIDATVRKTKPVKRPATDTDTEQTEHSEPKRSKPGIWFDNVDKILIEADTPEAGGKKGAEPDASNQLVKPDSFKGVTNCVAIDCEMVGIGPNGEESILARVSIVNHFGVCLYDKFVRPREKVTDYRTFVSGVTPENLATGEEFMKVQSEVSDLIKGRILVGHAIHNDLKVLFLTHPHKKIRDTSLYKPFRELFNGRLPSLKKLTEKVLGVSVQEGQHSSIQDAQATMRLYTMYRQKWEKEMRKEKKMKRKKKKMKKPKKDNV